jgi:hypothetical protein
MNCFAINGLQNPQELEQGLTVEVRSSMHIAF